MAARESATSVPTVIIRSTPDARAAATASATAASSAPEKWTWQWSSVQRPDETAESVTAPACPGKRDGTHPGRPAPPLDRPPRSADADAGEQRGALLHPAATRVTTPGRSVGQALLGRITFEADAPPHLGAAHRHGRRRQDGHQPEHLQRVTEDAVELGTGL